MGHREGHHQASVGDEVENHRHHDAMGHHHRGVGVDHRVVASHDEPSVADRDDRATCGGLVMGHGARHRVEASGDGVVSHPRDATHHHRAVASDPCHVVVGSDPVVGHVGASHDDQNHADHHALAGHAHHVAVVSDPCHDAVADRHHVANQVHRDDRAKGRDGVGHDRHLSTVHRDVAAMVRVDRNRRVRGNGDAVVGTIGLPRAP